MLFRTSALIAWQRYKIIEADSILFAFNKLNEIPEVKEPTFTYTHILAPHFPYVFDSEGNKTPPKYTKEFAGSRGWKEKDRYVGQLIFINKKVKETVEALLSKSETQPIIIIQGDHGTASRDQMDIDINKISKEQFDERMNILNAYYLPRSGGKELYETVTPVNSFRKILNLYFGTKYEMLPDTSYFSQHRANFKFVIAPGER